MTAEQWVRSTLTPHVVGNSLIIEYRTTASGMRRPVQEVAISVFLGYFGDAIEAALAAGASIYEALVSTDQQRDTDGVLTRNLGYQATFDMYKAEGLLM